MTSTNQPRRIARIIVISTLAAIAALVVADAALAHAPQPTTQEATTTGATAPTDLCPNGWRTDGQTITCLDAGQYAALPGAETPAGAPVDTQAVEEDEPGWDCRTMGNRVCGPENLPAGVVAGCYSGGVLVAPWTRFDVPSADPLWGQRVSPC